MEHAFFEENGERIRALCRRFERARVIGNKKQMVDVFRKLKEEVEEHCEIIEGSVLERGKTMHLPLRIEEEHEELNLLLQDLAQRYPFDKVFVGELGFLTGRLKHHLAEEENWVVREASFVGGEEGAGAREGWATA